VTMRGPLKKLDARRAGNIYYLREVVLPAGQYTLEATVEDLIAGKTGGVREPLRTGMGVPGFTVSDALVVRPFNAAADRLEADQILAYDGNAISPVLDPVFQANQPFTLQIYLIVYPDIYGAQPEMSLELLRHGRVVGRSALPFTDKIRNESVEGGSMGMVGEQKHEFPYLATLRGVQLGPGEYEARVTVRQGRNAPPLVDGRLRALGLELVQDRRELSHLVFLQVQLVGQEPQRPAHAEAAPAEVVPATPTTGSAERRAVMPSAPGTTTTMRAAAHAFTARRALARVPPRKRMHFVSTFRPGLVAPGGFHGRGQHATRR